MRILIINTVTTSNNGITHVIFNYIRAINGNEIVFDLVSRNKPDQRYIDDVERQGGHIYHIDKFGNLLKYIWQLRTLIRRNKYDAVHIHGNSHTVYIELIGVWLGGCKVRIVHAHNTSCGSMFAHKILTPFFNILCTNRLACGKAAGEFMFGKKPFIIINNGVDTEKFAFKMKYRSQFRYEWNCENDTKVIGHVGSFIAAKNHEFIIRVFDTLCKKSDKYRLVLIGGGVLRPVIEERINSWGLQKKVIFTGNINNVNEVLNAIDLILMPSLYEGLPLTLVEQQANGLKCVVSDSITQETDKTGNLRFVSLTAPISEWVDTIESLALEKDRDKCSKEAIKQITEAGYNIQVESQKLKDFYLKN